MKVHGIKNAASYLLFACEIQELVGQYDLTLLGSCQIPFVFDQQSNPLLAAM